MNWAKAFAAVLLFWSSTAWGATLTWNPGSEPDLAGYRVYQCSQQPCTRESGNASPLVTLGTATSFNIGTPAVTAYYFVTAYDLSDNESAQSDLATFTPAGTLPPVDPSPVTPPPATPLPVEPPPVAPPPVAMPPVTPPPVTPPPAIGVSPLRLSFAATLGGGNPATQTVSISNTGGDILSWSASDNAPWLTLSRALGTGNGVVSASVSAGTLGIGTYTGSITLSAIGTFPVIVPVTFTVQHRRHRYRR